MLQIAQEVELEENAESIKTNDECSKTIRCFGYSTYWVAVFLKRNSFAEVEK